MGEKKKKSAARKSSGKHHPKCDAGAHDGLCSSLGKDGNTTVYGVTDESPPASVPTIVVSKPTLSKGQYGPPDGTGKRST